VIPSQHINMDNDGRLSIIRLIYSGEIQLKNLCRENDEIKMSLEEALVMVHGHGATHKEYYVYSVLDIADGCEKVKVAYLEPGKTCWRSWGSLA